MLCASGRRRGVGTTSARLPIATTAWATRRRCLPGRARFARAAAANEPWRRDDGQLPATWEVIYAHAWGPPPGAPIRTGGVDEVSVPLSSIKVRRR